MHLLSVFRHFLLLIRAVFLWFSLDTISRKTLYNSSILRQDYGIIRNFIGHYQSAYLYGILCQDYILSTKLGRQVRAQKALSYSVSLDVITSFDWSNDNAKNLRYFGALFTSFYVSNLILAHLFRVPYFWNTSAIFFYL